MDLVAFPSSSPCTRPLMTQRTNSGSIRNIAARNLGKSLHAQLRQNKITRDQFLNRKRLPSKIEDRKIEYDNFVERELAELELEQEYWEMQCELENVKRFNRGELLQKSSSSSCSFSPPPSSSSTCAVGVIKSAFIKCEDDADDFVAGENKQQQQRQNTSSTSSISSQLPQSRASPTWCEYGDDDSDDEIERCNQSDETTVTTTVNHQMRHRHEQHENNNVNVNNNNDDDIDEEYFLEDPNELYEYHLMMQQYQQVMQEKNQLQVLDSPFSRFREMAVMRFREEEELKKMIKVNQNEDSAAGSSVALSCGCLSKKEFSCYSYGNGRSCRGQDNQDDDCESRTSYLSNDLPYHDSSIYKSGGKTFLAED